MITEERMIVEVEGMADPPNVLDWNDRSQRLPPATLLDAATRKPVGVDVERIDRRTGEYIGPTPDYEHKPFAVGEEIARTAGQFLQPVVVVFHTPRGAFDVPMMDLCHALADVLDAGGHQADLVEAIDALIEARISARLLGREDDPRGRETPSLIEQPEKPML